MFSQINDMFTFRNWMAHGRYWDYPYSKGKHNFDVVWIIVNEVENAFCGSLYAYDAVGEKVQNKNGPLRVEIMKRCSSAKRI